MKRFLNYTLYGILWVVTLLPLRFLYLVSDFLYFLAFYVIKYRRKVVYENLRNAFPEKENKELDAIARDFYHYLTDFIIESVALINLSRKELGARFRYLNPELLTELYHQGRNIALVSGHCGNWEWITDFPRLLNHHFFVLYHPLQNQFSDNLIVNLRNKYGGNMVPMQKIVRTLVEFRRHSSQPFGIWFLADQRPPAGTGFRTDFLNQDTAFYEGFARIAQTHKMALVYMQITKVSRGSYSTNLVCLTEDASQHTTGELVEMYARQLETQIICQPAYWLWSHKRWKHKQSHTA